MIQKMMVAEAGVDFKTETCTAGHSPFLSQPQTVLKVIEKIAKTHDEVYHTVDLDTAVTDKRLFKRR